MPGRDRDPLSLLGHPVSTVLPQPGYVQPGHVRPTTQGPAQHATPPTACLAGSRCLAARPTAYEVVSGRGQPVRFQIGGVTVPRGRPLVTVVFCPFWHGCGTDVGVPRPKGPAGPQVRFPAARNNHASPHLRPGEQAWQQLAAAWVEAQFAATEVVVTAFSGDRWQSLHRLPLFKPVSRGKC
jgi:hypothetical protein